MPTLAQDTHEIKGSRRGAGNMSTGDGWMEAKYKVYFTDTSATSIDAYDATGVPLWGTQLGTTGAYLLEKSAQPDDNDQNIWIVTITYRTLQANQQQPRFNPTTDHGKWNIIKNVIPCPVEIPIQMDANGESIVNFLGEVPNPPLTRVQYDMQFNISFSTDSFDQTNIEACKGKTNSETVVLTVGGVGWTSDPGSLVFQCPPLQEAYDNNGIRFCQTTYQLLYRSDGWVDRIPTISNEQNYTPGTGTITIGPILNGHSQPEHERFYLDSDGLPIKTSGVTIPTADYDTHGTANFDALLLGLI